MKTATAPVLPPPGSGECSACLLALAAQIPIDSVTRHVLAALDEIAAAVPPPMQQQGERAAS